MSQFQSTLSNESYLSYLILDDLFYLRSMRRDVYKVCRDHQVPIAIIHVNTPVSLALQRNRMRPLPQQIPDDVSRNFLKTIFK